MHTKMAAKVKLYVLLITLYFVAKSQILIEGQQIPCLFTMGDSLCDNGNNNFLFTLAKTNYLPYGIDYPDGPTGRFTNGKNVADFLAEVLGFEKPMPPFSLANGADILKGINYASGGAGILDYTGTFEGDRINMDRQLLNHGIVISKIALLLGNASMAREHLSKCLYNVNMGSNEYVNNYFQSPLYFTKYFYTPQQFAAIIIKRYSKQLRTLYKYGARKVAVFGLASIGCIPQMLSTNINGSKKCDDSINNVVKLFNDRLKPLIDTLNADLSGARFIMINATNIVLGDHSDLGIKINEAPCCSVSITGLCEAGKEICSNRDEYYYWDNYHPTEAGNRAVAARSYHARLPLDAYPIDIQTLVQQ